MGDVLSGSQSPGGQFWRFPKRRGLCAESPAGTEELASVEEISCAEEIAGAMAIASVGVSL